MDNLFSTHPNTENRIAALQALAAEIGRAGRGGARFRRALSVAQAVGRRLRAQRGPWGN